MRYCSLPEAVREHFLWSSRSIVIAGTHGKTTTTSLTGWLLVHGGLDPEHSGRRHRAQPRRGRLELSAGQGARLRHRGGRVRQRVLRQDREVPEVSAGHRRHQQRRVRSRRHLRRSRCGAARVPPAGQSGAALGPAAARRRFADALALKKVRRQPGRDIRAGGVGRLARNRRRRVAAAGQSFNVLAWRRAVCDDADSAVRRAQRSQRAGVDCGGTRACRYRRRPSPKGCCSSRA